jgi:predicted ABC-type ATPase
MNETEITMWTKTHKKSLIAEIIGNAKPSDTPTAIIMAGVPGAGKTEFLNHITPEIDDIVVIDLDAIVAKMPDYQPAGYYKYRKAANIVVSGTLAAVLKNQLNFALDGTFSHSKGAENIARALKHGYEVSLFLVDQNPALAWQITKARRVLTGRPIEHAGFVHTCHNVVPNVQNAIKTFRDQPNFFVSIIKKDDLNKYEYLDAPEQVDNYLKTVYNKYTERQSYE